MRRRWAWWLSIGMIGWLLLGCGGKQEETPQTPPTGPAAGPAGTGGSMMPVAGGPPGPLMSGPGAPGMPGMPGAPGMPGMPGAPGAAPPPAPAAPREKLPPLEAHRPDPFAPLVQPPKFVPPPPIRIYFRPTLQKPRIPPPPPPERVATVPGGRMAGLLWGENAWAILELNAKGHVVKPGDVVEGWRVKAIMPDKLLLQREEEEEVYEVPFRRLAEAGTIRVGVEEKGRVEIPELPPVPQL